MVTSDHELQFVFALFFIRHLSQNETNSLLFVIHRLFRHFLIGFEANFRIFTMGVMSVEHPAKIPHFQKRVIMMMMMMKL